MMAAPLSSWLLVDGAMQLLTEALALLLFMLVFKYLAQL